MAITIYNQPPALIMAHQPVVFRIASNSTESPLRLAGGVVDYGSDSVPADGSGEARFNLSDYLKELTTQRYIISDTPESYTDSVKSVEFAFGEIYGTPPTMQNILTTTDFAVLDGRIPKRKIASFYSTYNHVLAWLIATKSCITWWPLAIAKKVLPDQNEFLNYIQVQNSSAKDLHLEVTLLYTDGTTESMGQVYSTLTGIAQFAMTYWPVGYTQLGIAAWVAANNPGKTVKRYTATIYNSATAYSAGYIYEVDRSYYENTRKLYIRNPFGMLEILLCRGLGSSVSEYESQDAVTSGLSTQEKIIWYNRKTESVKVSTGFMKAEEILWLSDLLETIEAYELIDGALQPIILKDIKVATRHDGDYQFASDIEYEYTFIEQTEEGA